MKVLLRQTVTARQTHIELDSVDIENVMKVLLCQTVTAATHIELDSVDIENVIKVLLRQTVTARHTLN